jgi:hypothetical protein
MNNNHWFNGPTSVLVLSLVLLTPAHPQAPGSVFGQQPQQLQRHLERPHAQVPPTEPPVKPAVKAPNWNAIGPNAAPRPLSPPAARPTTHPVQTLNTEAPSKKTSAFALSKEKLTKTSPRRAALLQAQLKIRDEQNRVAQGLRGHADRRQITDKPPGSHFAQAPGRTSSLAAGAEAHLPHAARNARTQDMLANQPDGIWFVNNQANDFIITPGGSVVISGKGFGERPGQVFAKGLTGFPGGAAELQVQGWNNFEIDAVLPAGIRNVADLNAISVQVLTFSSRSFSLGNGRFYAERAEIVLPQTIDLHAVFDVQLSRNWMVNFNPGLGPASSVEMTGNGWVERFDDSSELTCKQPGTDTLFPKNLPYDFQVSGIAMEHGRTDSGDGNGMPNGDSGNHMYVPGYSITWGQTTVAAGPNRDKLVDAVAIGWGVWRSHTSPGIVQNKEDICASRYVITEVDVVGPVGLAPF